VQRELLEKEGIVFENDGTIDLKKYGWFGWIYCKNMIRF
jgi:alkylated DNA nucleotide flippase Atl1